MKSPYAAVGIVSLLATTSGAQNQQARYFPTKKHKEEISITTSFWERAQEQAQKDIQLIEAIINTGTRTAINKASKAPKVSSTGSLKIGSQEIGALKKPKAPKKSVGKGFENTKSTNVPSTGSPKTGSKEQASKSLSKPKAPKKSEGLIKSKGFENTKSPKSSIPKGKKGPPSVSASPSVTMAPSDDLSPVPSTFPSKRPSSVPLFLPSSIPSTNSNTELPIAVIIAPTVRPTQVLPTSSPVSSKECVHCTDTEPPIMTENNEACTASQAMLMMQCNNNDEWIVTRYCEQSCFLAGNGYGDICCPANNNLSTIPSHVPSGSSSIAPSAAPSTVPSHTPSNEPSALPSPVFSKKCVHCTDTEPPIMTENNEDCTASQAMLMMQCNNNGEWIVTRYCEQSCFLAGNGYGDICCPATNNPSTVPSHVPSGSSSIAPSAAPSTVPSHTPSNEPSALPSSGPLLKHSVNPSSVPCTVCRDEVTPAMAANRENCSSSRYLLSITCNNKSAEFKTNKFCELSCFLSGAGYTDICCPSSSHPSNTPTQVRPKC